METRTQTQHPRRIPAEALLLGTVLLWSFNFTAIRYGITRGFEPLSYASLRWALAGVALTALACALGHSLRVGRRDLLVLTAAAVIGVFANQIGFVYAVRSLTASTVALVFGTLPIFISLVAQVSGLERLQPRHWIATCVSFGGVILIASGAHGGLSANTGGIALAVGATLAFAVYSVMVVPVMTRHSPIVVNAITASIGAVLLLAVSGTVLAGQRWDGIGALGWGSLLYSALVSIALGNLLWFTAIDRVGPGRSALFANLQPFLGAVFAVLVLSETLNGRELVGGAVVAIGIALGKRTGFDAAPHE